MSPATTSSVPYNKFESILFSMMFLSQSVNTFFISLVNSLSSVLSKSPSFSNKSSLTSCLKSWMISAELNPVRTSLLELLSIQYFRWLISFFEMLSILMLEPDCLQIVICNWSWDSLINGPCPSCGAARCTLTSLLFHREEYC